jgi:hypothetical protein
MLPFDRVNGELVERPRPNCNITKPLVVSLSNPNISSPLMGEDTGGGDKNCFHLPFYPLLIKEGNNIL